MSRWGHLWNRGHGNPHAFGQGYFAFKHHNPIRVGWDFALSVFGIVREALEGETNPSVCWAQVINTYLYAYLPWVIALSSGWLVPDFVAWIMAVLIMGSWVFAAINMRRALRRRAPGKTKSSS